MMKDCSRIKIKIRQKYKFRCEELKLIWIFLIASDRLQATAASIAHAGIQLITAFRCHIGVVHNSPYVVRIRPRVQLMLTGRTVSVKWVHMRFSATQIIAEFW